MCRLLQRGTENSFTGFGLTRGCVNGTLSDSGGFPTFLMPMYYYRIQRWTRGSILPRCVQTIKVTRSIYLGSKQRSKRLWRRKRPPLLLTSKGGAYLQLYMAQCTDVRVVVQAFQSSVGFSKYEKGTTMLGPDIPKVLRAMILLPSFSQQQ